MRSAIVVFALVVFAIAPLAQAQKLEFAEDLTFTIPADSISCITFRDIGDDSLPEVLLVGDESLFLYSITLDSFLFRTDLPDPTFYSYAVTLADVNRDSIVDLVLGSFYPHHTRVDMWDGASEYAAHSSVSFGPFLGWHGWKSGLVAAVDLDRDGFEELVVSWDDESSIDSWESRLQGGTIVYASFPNLTVDSIRTQSLRIDSLLNPDGSYFYVTQQHDAYSWLGTGPDWTDSWSWLAKPWPDSPSSFLVGGDHFGGWTDDYCFSALYQNHWELACGGDLKPDRLGVEFLVVRDYSTLCHRLDPQSPDLYTWDSTSLFLFSLVASDSAEEIWSRDVTGQTWANFLYHTDFPGYFFAFVDGDFIMYDVDGDSVYQTNTIVADGQHSWTWSFPDHKPRLVALDGNHATLYRLDIATDMSESPSPVSLPQAFTVSDPYPNPFNPSVSFSLKMPVKAAIAIDIHNTLGQRVERLFEGTLAAGVHAFEWNGRDFASGVYMITVRTESASRTVKAVLLK